MQSNVFLLQTTVILLFHFQTFLLHLTSILWIFSAFSLLISISVAIMSANQPTLHNEMDPMAEKLFKFANYGGKNG